MAEGQWAGAQGPPLSGALTRIWDPGVRLFHWLLVAVVSTALVTGLFAPRNWLNLHLAAGAAIGALVTFRILWGCLGSTYARFASFAVSPAAIADDLAGLAAGRRPTYFGHNPLGSLMTLALLVILTLIVVTGVVTLAGVDKQGPMAFATSYATGKATQRIHQALAYGLIALIAGHLSGVAYESAHGHAGLVRAMLTGEKPVSTGHAARPASARPVAAALVLALLLAVAAHEIAALSQRPAQGAPVGPLDPTYLQECGSCHMAYPPSLAPASRWIAIMEGLGDHFGEDASLEPGIASRIRAYLVINSAEKWDTRAANEFQRSNPQDPLRLTATPIWTRIHRGIPESVFKSRAVGAKSACDKCHSDASTGRFDPQNIRIPEQASK
jgi:cytochrome b